MAERKSTRVKSGLGGRPKGDGVRHTTSHRQQEPDIEELSPDDAIHRDEEIEDDIREAIRVAVTSNMKNISKWIKQVGEDDPKGALTMMKDYIEFVLPKLQRTDSKLDSSNPIELKFETIDDYKLRREQEEINKRKINPDNEFPTNI